MADWLKIVLIALGVAIVLSVVFHFVNRAFRNKYGFGLYGGALLMLLAAAGIGGGGYLVATGTTLWGVVLIAVGIIPLVITLVWDFKKCGGAGIWAFLLQIVFCVPALFVIFDIIFNKGNSTINNPTVYGSYNKKRRKDEDERY